VYIITLGIWYCLLVQLRRRRTTRELVLRAPIAGLMSDLFKSPLAYLLLETLSHMDARKRAKMCCLGSVIETV